MSARYWPTGASRRTPSNESENMTDGLYRLIITTHVNVNSWYDNTPCILKGYVGIGKSDPTYSSLYQDIQIGKYVAGIITNYEGISQISMYVNYISSSDQFDITVVSDDMELHCGNGSGVISKSNYYVNMKITPERVGDVLGTRAANDA